MTNIWTVENGFLARRGVVQSGEQLFGALYGRVVGSLGHTAGVLPAVSTAGTSRYHYTINQSANNLRLVYINWYNSAATGSPACHDFVNTDPISLQALVFMPGAATGTPVTVGGQTTWTIPSGGWIQTDPIQAPVAAGQTIDVQTYVSGAQWYPTATLYSGVAGFTPGNYATSGSSKINYSAGPYYAPATITGDRNGPAVLEIGDSILYGAATFSYVDDGLSGKYGVINTGVIGDRLYWYLSGSYRQQSLSLFANNDCTTVICEYGRNDLEDSRTPTQMQSDYLTIWNQFNSVGKRIIQTTITPHTNSTDSWATDTNQTVTNATFESHRVQINTWIRAGAPIISGVAVAPGTGGAVVAGQPGHPLYNYWEITDHIETARDSGKWKAGYTSDGLHPNSTGALQAASGVDVSMIV